MRYTLKMGDIKIEIVEEELTQAIVNDDSGVHLNDDDLPDEESNQKEDTIIISDDLDLKMEQDSDEILYLDNDEPDTADEEVATNEKEIDRKEDNNYQSIAQTNSDGRNITKASEIEIDEAIQKVKSYKPMEQEANIFQPLELLEGERNMEDILSELDDRLKGGDDIEEEAEENKLLDSLCILDLDNIDNLALEETPIFDDTKQKKTKIKEKTEVESKEKVEEKVKEEQLKEKTNEELKETVIEKAKEEAKEENKEELKEESKAESKESNKPEMKRYYKEKYLRRKAITYNEKEETYTCQYCGYNSKKKKCIVMHVTMKHYKPKGGTPDKLPKIRKKREKKELFHYDCPHCEFRTSSRMIYKSHMQREHNVSVDIFICPFCDFQAKRKDNFMRHMKVRHEEGDTVYECKSCEYTARNKFAYRLHVKRMHSLKKCALCDFQTNRKSKLSRHMSIIHGEGNETGPSDQLYKCTLCDYETKFQSYMKKHVYMIHNEAALLYKCPFCEYETKRNDSLRRHFIVRHEENAELLKCTLCDYTTKLKGYLSKHVRTVHNKGPGSMMRCSVCGFETQVRNELQKHMQVSHNKIGRHYQCPSCDYKSEKRIRVDNHIKMKHDLSEESYKCILCDYETKCLPYMRMHMKAKHSWY